ncbi:BQ5605_C026g10158 [Microbotryum silenes-dioicae]|uniref:Transcription initiation factor TFIID subunit 4 n=1 Tax=Microbotryum silenes-dioicae TaxID=796604 RepID=A0A2X0PG74_9BASI|nr:BQ5605_C026g10158 [Microbotryum silenes-dioicae]
MPSASSAPPPSQSPATVSTPTASASVSTPKPGGGRTGGGLQLPGALGNKGKTKANPSAETSRNTTRDTLKEPHETTTNTNTTTGKFEHEPSTNVQHLMDAVGASGVDINAEEDSLRQHQPVGSHFNTTSTSQQPNPSTTHTHTHTHTHTATTAASSAPSTSTLTDLDLRIHSQSFIDPQVLADVVRKIAAEYSLKSLEGQTIPLIALACRTRLMDLISNSIRVRDHRLNANHLRKPPFDNQLKRRRRDQALGEEYRVHEEDDMLQEGKKEPVWDAVVYDEPEKALWVLEKVDREEERKRRRERVLRDEKEQEEKELREAVEASERAREEQERDDIGISTHGVDGTDQTTTNTLALTGNMETPKSNPLLKKKKKRDLGQAAIAKNLSGDVQKRLTDQIAMRSLGGRSFSWLSGAGGAAAGGSSMLTPNRPHNQSAIGTPTLGTTPSARSSSLNPFPSSLNRLTTIPSLHDANRQKLDAEETWRQGTHVVELKDILFALDNQRGMGLGKGAGKVASLKARAGVVRKA